MTAASDSERKSFVLLPLGGRRLALPTESVIEMVASGHLQKFPHATPCLTGVIVRRGRVVPVCEVGKLLGFAGAPEEKFYLVASWENEGARDWCAIPVAGECELASAEHVLPPGECPPYIAGLLPGGKETVEVLDLGKLICSQREAHSAAPKEPRR